MWILFFLTTIAHASCSSLSLSDFNNIDFQSSINPTLTLKIKRAGSGGCSFFITASNGSASSFASRKIQYNSYSVPVQIYTDASATKPIKSFPEISSSADIISGSFPEGDSNPKELTASLYPRIDSSEYQRFGNYNDDFVVRLYEGIWNSSYILKDTKNFSLKNRILKKIDLSIVNPGNAFDQSSTNKNLNFGTLVSGQKLDFDLLVKYNAGYQVRVSSQNKGRLKHLNYSDTIPYTLRMNGNPLTLGSSPAMVCQGSGVSPIDGLRFSNSVTVGPLGTPPAGTYQDIITLTVTTTE